MSGTDLPQKISDEDAVELLARRAWRRRHSITWESALDIERQEFLTAARLDLAALVASGYRREADVLREAARDLLDNHYERSRPDIATMAGWLEMRADLREQATALEQAQPLLAAGSEVESLEPRRCPSGIHSTQGESPECWCTPVAPAEGQERSEEKEHG